MTGKASARDKYKQLIEQGYCIFEQILDDAFLQQLRDTCGKLIGKQTEEESRALRAMGTDIPLQKDSFFAELIAWPKALEALAALGYAHPKFRSGYVISKPPHSPRLFWHHDYDNWEDSGCFDETPQQLFLMYYLVDTTATNGCLRVIPGTHRHDNPLHAELEEAHSQRLRAALDPDRPAFSTRPDEMDVPVKAGDLLIGDSRLLHATHSNQSDDFRTVITLWYIPDMQTLSEPLQAAYAHTNMQLSEEWQAWPAAAKEKLNPLWPRYEGAARPLPGSRARPPRGR